VNPIAFEIGSYSIRWYGLLISVALGLGTYLAYKEGARKGMDPEHVLNIVLLVAPVAIIGARIYYVLFTWEAYKDNIWEALAIWHGGLAIHGGLIAGVLVGYWYVKRHSLPFWKLADIMAPSIILGQAIGRWGNFFNQEAHGGPVSQEFISHFPKFIQEGMNIRGVYYHPTFLYESFWNILVFIFLLFLRRKKNIPAGTIFLSYFILYSVGRFFIEALRTDSLMIGSFRVAQLISVGFVLVAGAILYGRYKKQLPRN
jgi:phosphatidylglycerol:prolipoprotein diacylglycerol transferase